MSKTIRNRQVGMYIENGPEPTVLLYVDHVWLTRKCKTPEEAERVYAEFADVFDLWLEDRPKWVPPREALDAFRSGDK